MTAISEAVQREIDAARAKVRFRYPWWLRPFLMRDVAAITLGRRIYLDADLRGMQLEKLLRHELAHVRQITRLGVVPFYIAYTREYLRYRRAGLSNGEAYRRISFEVEAVAAEDV